MTNHLVLVDTNQFGFAGMNNPRLSAGDKDTQSVFSTIKTIRNIFLDYPDAMVMCLFDGRSWRKDIYKEYKANREKTDKQVEDRKAYYEQAKLIRQGLKLLGVTQVSAGNMEADDLAYMACRSWEAKGGKVTVVTGDKDWLQLVSKQTCWVDRINDRYCNWKNFQEVTGFKDQAQFIEAKCILGDAGDNIKGINGIGKKTLEKIYQMTDSFIDFLFWKEEAIEAEWMNRFLKKPPKIVKEFDRILAAKTVKENLKLVDLGTPYRPEAVNLVKDRQPLDEEGFTTFCYENSFLSIAKDMGKFIKPFKENPNVIR